MEKGNRMLPPLDGRELRLKRLERYFEDFLTRTANIDALADERARVRLQLSEVSLAAGDAAGGEQAAWRGAARRGRNLPMDAELKFRMATNSLLLALLRQSNARSGDRGRFRRRAQGARRGAAARRWMRIGWTNCWRFWISTRRNCSPRAARIPRRLAQLMRATQTLNWIADQRPDAAILRSELAACYLSSATILEGMGSLGDAREVRALASVEFVKLLKDKPGDFALRLDLAGCYGAMAESAVLSGDIVGAESISQEAMKLLDQLVVEQPDNAEAVSRKAAQLGLRAGIQRDRGLSAEAMADYDDGIRMLEAIRASAPGQRDGFLPAGAAVVAKRPDARHGRPADEEIALIRQGAGLARQAGVRARPPPVRGPSNCRAPAPICWAISATRCSLPTARTTPSAPSPMRWRCGKACWHPARRARNTARASTWCRQRLRDLK